MNLEGIRPLYYLRFGGYILMIALLVAQFSEQRHREIAHRGELGLWQGIAEVFAQGPPIRRWVIVEAMNWLPYAMTLPFLQLFAHEVKGAEQYIIGGMTTATLLAPLLIGVPVGRLADKYGRKKVLYCLAPAIYAASVVLVLSSGPAMLLLAGFLQGFYLLSFVVSGALGAELVPKHLMGRWMGLLGMFRGLASIPAPLLAGWIWREMGPAYVFLLAVALDLAIRIPALMGMPETLRGAGDKAPSR
jgi:MFS family permease